MHLYIKSKQNREEINLTLTKFNLVFFLKKHPFVYTKILVATNFCKPSKLKCCTHICEFGKNLQNLQIFRLANISNNKIWCKSINQNCSYIDIS